MVSQTLCSLLQLFDTKNVVFVKRFGTVSVSVTVTSRVCLPSVRCAQQNNNGRKQSVRYFRKPSESFPLTVRDPGNCLRSVLILDLIYSISQIILKLIFYLYFTIGDRNKNFWYDACMNYSKVKVLSTPIPNFTNLNCQVFVRLKYVNFFTYKRKCFLDFLICMYFQ